jgi:hypothetical protein
MSYFIDKFLEACATKGTTPYKVAVDSHLDPPEFTRVIAGKELKPKTMMRYLENLAESNILGVSLPTLKAWWAMDYMDEDILEELNRINQAKAKRRKK